MIVVEAMIHPSGRTVEIYCPFCRCRHAHGRGNGIVLSHCAGGARGSYELVEGRQLTWDELRRLPMKQRRNLRDDGPGLDGC